MKKTLTLLIASMFIIGCDEVHIIDKIIITKSELNLYSNHKGRFKYTANEDYHNGILVIMTDSVYSVGDTITFKK
jgi:predicted house-cleaning NTP pyrophosphatase (Maf/HAM1 superfamily)